jgi:hypothetical protein
MERGRISWVEGTRSMCNEEIDLRGPEWDSQ